MLIVGDSMSRDKGGYFRLDGITSSQGTPIMGNQSGVEIDFLHISEGGNGVLMTKY